jgi:predicted esterase
MLHHFEIKKTARYATLGNLSAQTEQIWFVCHGYGQLAEYFIRKFNIFDEEKHFVVAPEGLSRFYLDNFSGRVGATWMTKEDRKQEIEDYLAYLNQLYAHIFEDASLSPDDFKINIMGFSQGVATASRWVFDGKVKFDSFVMWAGNIAHDLDFGKTQAILGDKSLYFVYGEQDELIKPEHFAKQTEQLQKLNLAAKIIPFEGKHEVSREVLKTHFA